MYRGDGVEANYDAAPRPKTTKFGRTQLVKLGCPPRHRADYELFISASNSTKNDAASSDSGSVVDRKEGASLEGA